LLSASFVVIPLMLAAVAAIVFVMWCCCKISSRKDSVN
jgi:hypothetical protein